MAVVNWGIAPAEFWRMDNEDWWWLYDATRPRDPSRDYAGTLTDSVLAEIDAFARGEPLDDE